MKGIGSDLIDIRRIENTLSKYGDRFKKRIFTEIQKKMKTFHKFLRRFWIWKSKSHLLNLVLDNDYTINLSITDEFPYAQAIVTIN